jgi:hypothetical protein
MYFVLKEKYPHLAKQFSLVKNKPLKASDSQQWHKKNIWWVCEDNHFWLENVKKRVHQLRNNNNVSHCKICVGLQVDKQNNISNKAKFLLSEWDYKKNYPIKPEEVFYRTSTNYHWKCKRNHEWTATVHHRVLNNTRCPHCNKTSASLPELRIYAELSLLFKNIRHQYKINKHEADIFLEDYKIVIEYDGEYYHSNPKRFRNDNIKTNFFQKEGYKLIRMREGNLPPLKGLCIKVETDKFTKLDINNLLIQIRKFIKDKEINSLIDKYIKQKVFQNEVYFNELRFNLPSPPFRESLAFKHPDINKIWDVKKNYPLKPDNFKSGSAQKVNFICDKFKDHKWSATISGMVIRKLRCPFCSKHSGKTDPKESIKVLYPNLVKFLDSKSNIELNTLSIRPGSAKIVSWVCSKNKEHKFKRSIRDIVKAKKVICPNCAKNASGTDHNKSFGYLYSDKTKLFDQKLNNGIDIFNLKPSSARKLTWKCTKNPSHTFKRQVRHMTSIKGKLCPICKN